MTSNPIPITRKTNQSGNFGNTGQSHAEFSVDWPALMAYIELTERDLDILHQHQDFFAKNAKTIIDAFYVRLYHFPQLRAIIERHSSLNEIKAKTIRYFESLGTPVIDERYIQSRNFIGLTHVRVGVSQEWVMAATEIYLQLLEGNKIYLDW